MSNVSSTRHIMNTIRGIHADVWSSDSEVLSTYVSMTSSVWTLGLLDDLNNPSFRDELVEVAKASEWKNPFFEPIILNASIKNLAYFQVKFLYLSERVGEVEKLQFFAPVMVIKSPLRRKAVMKVWSHNYAPLGQPLIRQEGCEEILNGLSQCLLNANVEKVAVLALEDLPSESFFFQHITTCPLLTPNLVRLDQMQRAALFASKGDYSQRVSGKRRQRMNKAMRDLEKLGAVEYKVKTDPHNDMQMLEEFFELEKSGWKGKKGSALACKKETKNFAIQSVKEMSQNGQCEIHALEVDGKAVSSIIIYRSGGHYIPWKVAVNDDLAAYSVGTLLYQKLNEELTSRPGFEQIDSIAAPDNETANRFWPDRIKLDAVVYGFGDEGAANSKKVSQELLLMQNLKTRAKIILGKN